MEERFIPVAHDPKNEGLDETDDVYKMYYFIDSKINGHIFVKYDLNYFSCLYEDLTLPEDAQRFELDPTSRKLKLKSPLDREVVDHLTIHIIVTNNMNGIITNPNSINYTLEVQIEINDVNDNPPKLSQSMYAAGITSKDSIGKLIIAFKVIDFDV